MILEIEDIINQKHGMHHMAWPDKVTLGAVMSHRDLQWMDKSIASVTVNGMEVSDWRDVIPQGKGDKVRIAIAPKPFLFVPIIWGLTLMNILSIISLIVSIVQFVASLFSSPPKPPSRGGDAADSQVYSFDGIKTQITPGRAIPVTYGQHMGGGQVLSAFVDVTQGGIRQELSMLVGYGEGPITNINCVRINDTAIADIQSATAEIRLGTTSQAPISGFDQVRNTFSDGREIGSGTPIVYSTVSNSLTGVDLQVSATQGLANVRDGNKEQLTVWYTIERRPTGSTTFTSVQTKAFTGKTASSIWDVTNISITTPGAYDFRFSFLRESQQSPTVYDGGAGREFALGRLWLSNITERQGLTYAFSGIAHIGVKALATAQLNGQLPDVTAVIVGRTVDVYSTTAVKTTTWTQNPAWAVADYMTNSIYGMGAFIRTSDLNLQSFMDFATLCNSQVPNGASGLEDQHHLDLVMDARKSHWQWVKDMLSLYKSSVIYSQQQWKIITDRQDRPLRQVFHSGNMIAGKTRIKIGADPMKPNQANVNFVSQILDYEKDSIYVQDSASIAGAGDPIKDYDMQLFGIVRETEAIRTAKWDLDRKRSVRREIDFETGLEGIAVEPGDMCRVGIVNTNYEMGWGGRVLDGSSRHVVLDREVTVQSGFTYDLFLWHVQADTPETRTVATTVPAGIVSLVTAVVSPTSGFSFAALPDDRWSIGVTSVDLMLCQVKQVNQSRDGRTRIVAEQYLTLSPTTPVQAKLIGAVPTAPPLDQMPAQPMNVAVGEAPQTLRDGSVVSNLVIDVGPAPPYEGGRLTVPGTLSSITLAQASSHNPNADALIGEQIRFISGPASGLSPTIKSWAGAPSLVASVYPAFAAANVPASGNPYQLIKLGGLYAGMDVFTIENSVNPAAPAWVPIGTHYGTEIVAPNAPQSYSVAYKLVPLSDRGLRNENGCWVVSLTTAGDTIAPAQPGSIFAVQGTGKDVGVQVIPTSEADLWGHLFYRHTANCLTNAQTVGFGVTDYHDTNVSYETPYFYWARPVDYSFNVGSPVGPTTITASRIITGDITSNAVSNIIELTSANTLPVFNVEAVVGSLAITTLGGPVLLATKMVVENSTAGAPTLYESRLRVGSLGGISLDYSKAGGGADSSTALINQAIHSAPNGLNNYLLTLRMLYVWSGTVLDMRMQAVELKR